ncbi:hypothetical protein GCM10017044_09030 [Kordiimonas sediminis]|uniref:TonB C-terminal domain-containing protein n=1 Tax=Kordiimonas sediminis TaxID=1735581 RepID=A0A919E3T9_9PROT|nr:energy transducer TonB [Kordiimonas sediminis]GHF16874.1 hypothetical protein GCM10017044_09030 [Kordiimonas sediminis]
MKYLKISSVPVAATAATFGLAYVMQGMVAADELELQEAELFVFENVFYEEPPVKPRKIDRVIKPAPPEPRPKVPDVNDPVIPDGIPDYTPTPAPKAPRHNDDVFNPASMDGEMVPLVRVNPTYPVSARDRGIEGWAVAEFDVTEHGMVDNVRIIESEPGTVFDRATLKAVAKFRYKPRVVDGTAYGVKDVRFRMVYTLND